MKRIIVFLSLLITAGAGAMMFLYMRAQKESKARDKTAVYSVSAITGISLAGGQERYPGIVIPQSTVKIQKTEERKIQENRVSVGDSVKKGDVLWVYDLDDLKMAIEMGRLELQKMKSTKENIDLQIGRLQKERDKAPESGRTAYDIEILSLQMDSRETDYQINAKTAAQEKLEASLGNTEVLSPVDGLVTRINSPNANSDDNMNSEDSENTDADAYMVLTEVGNYRIRGSVLEKNRPAMVSRVGQEVLIRSRVNPETVWKGKLENVDTENAVSGDALEGDTETKYPFFITLESAEGLALGQHVLIEWGMDLAPALWIPSMYLSAEDDGFYIWAASKDDKLEKRKVETGGYDEDLDQYEVQSGLKVDDYIAIPADTLYEGQHVIRQEGTEDTDTEAETDSVDELQMDDDMD